MRRLWLFVLGVSCCWAQWMPLGGIPISGTPAPACTPATGYSNCGVFSVAATPSVLSNFPVVTKSGGALVQLSGVQSPSCYDVIATSDSAGTTLKPWEVDYCSVSAGTATIALWTAVTTSTTGSSKYYLSWGKSGIVAAQNTGANAPSNVLDAGYKGVWHLGDSGFATGATMHDSSANANNAIVGADYAAAIWSQIYCLIGKCVWDDGSNSSANLTTAGISLGSGAAWTASAWLQAAASANFTVGGNASTFTQILKVDSGSLIITDTVGNHYSSSLSTFTAGNWYYLAVSVAAGGNWTMYKNGVAIGSGSGATWAVQIDFLFGDKYSGSGYYDAGMPSDELRLSSVDRSADWTSSEYNNQGTGTLLTWSLF